MSIILLHWKWLVKPIIKLLRLLSYAFWKFIINFGAPEVWKMKRKLSCHHKHLWVPPNRLCAFWDNIKIIFTNSTRMLKAFVLTQPPSFPLAKEEDVSITNQIIASLWGCQANEPIWDVEGSQCSHPKWLWWGTCPVPWYLEKARQGEVRQEARGKR